MATWGSFIPQLLCYIVSRSHVLSFAWNGFLSTKQYTYIMTRIWLSPYDFALSGFGWSRINLGTAFNLFGRLNIEQT